MALRQRNPPNNVTYLPNVRVDVTQTPSREFVPVSSSSGLSMRSVAFALAFCCCASAVATYQISRSMFLKQAQAVIVERDALKSAKEQYCSAP